MADEKLNPEDIGNQEDAKMPEETIETNESPQEKRSKTDAKEFQASNSNDEKVDNLGNAHIGSREVNTKETVEETLAAENSEKDNDNSEEDGTQENARIFQNDQQETAGTQNQNNELDAQQASQT